MKQLKISVALFLFFAVQAYAQTIGTDSLSIQRLMYQPKIDTVSTWIRNLSKTDSLFYHAIIEYKRTDKELLIQDSLQLQAFKNQAFSQHINYVDTAFLSASYGNPDRSSVTVGVRFKSGSEGFNLSDIGTWFIAGEDTSDVVRVQIRVGGNSIHDAVVVSEGAARYEISKSELNGHLYGIKLKKPVVMYPNEDFYVLFTYPAGIPRPQGCANNSALPAVAGRYWIEKDGQLVDLQQQEGYSNAAWLMYAAEESSKAVGWLHFASPADTVSYNPADTILASDSALLRLQLDGSVADLGSQYADIVIHSNDTINPVVRIPVHLRLNEAPYFLEAPSELFVAEAGVLTVHIRLEDNEKDVFEIIPAMGCKFVQFSACDSVMTLNISPQKGDVGDYVVKFKAIDAYGAERELKITIHVSENRAPSFIDPPVEITLEEGDSLEVRIEAFDSEGDMFEISLREAPDFVQLSFERPVVTLRFSPQVGQSGEYAIKLLARDTIGLEREWTVPVYVLHKNRPPVARREAEPFTFAFMDEAVRYDINEYFMDLDNDPFTFEIFCHNSNIVTVTVDDESHFTLKPLSTGGTILDFILRDARGEQAQYPFQVIVGSCEDPARIIVQKWNKVLLVNNGLGEYAAEGFQWYKNGQPIKNATRQYYSSEDDTGGQLEAGVEYFVRIVKLNGDTIYTCPCVPAQNQAEMLKVYPNPVTGGDFLNIEMDITNADSGTIQILDILGHTRKNTQISGNAPTVQMPETPGLYIVKVVFGDREDIFRVKVK